MALNLGTSQAALSKMENQGDMQVSTLRRLLGAMGGTLELAAQFDGWRVDIAEFGGNVE